MNTNQKTVERVGHTAIPARSWKIAEFHTTTGMYHQDGGASVVTADGEPVAVVAMHAKLKRGEGHKQKCAIRDANARLMSAAPDLLEACKTDEQLTNLHDELRSNYARIREAGDRTVEYKGIAQQNVTNILAQIRGITERRRAAIAKATGGAA